MTEVRLTLRSCVYSAGSALEYLARVGSEITQVAIAGPGLGGDIDELNALAAKQVKRMPTTGR